MDTRPNDITEFKAQALETCLSQIESGANLEEALKPYGNLAAELRPLIEVALANRAYAASLAVPALAMTRSRARFLNAAQTYVERSQRSWFSGIVFPRLAMAIVAFIAVLLIGSFSTAVASAESLPGDWLYPVKLASEKTRLLLTGNPINRIRLEKTFDDRREQEILELLKHDRSEIVRLGGEVTSIQPGVWIIRDTTVLVDSSTQLEHDIEPGFYVEVSGLLQPNGELQAQTIRARQIQFSGTVDEIGSDQWVIDGLAIQVTGSTLWSGAPTLGTHVTATAFVLADGSLRAYQIQISDSSGTAVTWTSEPIEDLEKTMTPSGETLSTQTPTPISRPIEASETEESEDDSSNQKPDDDSNDDEHRDKDGEKEGDHSSDSEKSSDESHTSGNISKSGESHESGD